MNNFWFQSSEDTVKEKVQTEEGSKPEEEQVKTEVSVNGDDHEMAEKAKGEDGDEKKEESSSGDDKKRGLYNSHQHWALILRPIAWSFENLLCVMTVSMC